MNSLYKILFSLFLVFGVASCEYLDIVPDETATEKDAFATTRAAENFLYSCYGYIPDPRSGTGSIDLFTGDEVVTPYEHETFANFPKGNITALNPVISYWNDLFSGIRQCYIFKDGVASTPGITQDVVDDYMAQADFLIAYYHYLLLRSYGPIILVKEKPALDTAPEDFLGRTPYDECVQWISDLFEDAAKRLPNNRPNQRVGLATSTAAKAIRGRMLLYAASPQFNGNSAYADFKNPDGTALMNTTFDPNKWVLAKTALKEAIDAAESAGHRLYESTDATYSEYPEPAQSDIRALRFTLVDKASKENIWVDARREGWYALQNKSTPFYSNNGEAGYNGIAPTLAMLDRFYTENGLPISEDPNFDYNRRFTPSVFPEDNPNGEGETQVMNLGREPRYYAWIAFHGGYFEVTGNYTDAKNHRAYAPENLRGINDMKLLTRFKRNDPMGINARNNNYVPTGFLNKKGVHPGYVANLNWSNTYKNYPWPVVRLADLYLSYAEACVETNDLDEAKKYLDKVRTRAGIPSVDAAWSSIGVALSQSKLREIVRQERMIELYLEGHNFWDMRRWLLAEKYFVATPEGNNVMSDVMSEFAVRTKLNGEPVPGGTAPNIVRDFKPRHYLMPIPYNEVQKNKNLVQNPGY